MKKTFLLTNILLVMVLIALLFSNRGGFNLDPKQEKEKSDFAIYAQSGITGSGIARYIPLWTGSTVLGNSVVYQTTGDNIGIGTTSPAEKLHVAGRVRVTQDPSDPMDCATKQYVDSLAATCQSGPTDCGTISDSRDGKTYPTVQIGSQCWMAENLDYAGHSVGASSCYDNNAGNCAVYGRLYDWYAAAASCPSGWSIASDSRWQVLEEYLGMCAGTATGCSGTIGYRTSGDVGSKLAWFTLNGTNSSGFTALGGGRYVSVSSPYYSNLGHGWWWTSSPWIRGLHPTLSSVERTETSSYTTYQNWRYSVRCIKN